MFVAETHNIVDIRLVRLGSQRVTKKDQKINLIMLDLGSQLLASAQMAGKILVDGQICYLLDEPSGSSGCLEIVLA